MKMRKKKEKFQPVTFVPVRQVFKPMVEIIVNHDLSGWADREKRQKWHMAAGSSHIIDEDKAREFVAKGYAEFTDPKRHKISQDERDEHLASVTTLRPGGDG